MTLDEAIEHCEEVAMDNINHANLLWNTKEKERCEDCAKEHRQLAEWLKDYKRLLEQEPFMNKPCVARQVCHEDKVKVLAKIRAEIEQMSSRYTISRERGGMGQVEWEDRLIKEADILQIIDKYKAESEE